MISLEIRFTESSIPPITLRAFRSMAEHAPSKVEVFPVTMVPSESSMAAAGSPVSSAFCFAAATAGLSSLETLACSMRS